MMNNKVYVDFNNLDSSLESKQLKQRIREIVEQ